MYSKWTWACVAFSETFEALVDGLQRALWALGGVPSELLTDNLSAATHELKGGGGRALTRRFADVCEHLGLERESDEINPGKSNENGAWTRSAIAERRSCSSKRSYSEEVATLTPSRTTNGSSKTRWTVRTTVISPPVSTKNVRSSPNSPLEVAGLHVLDPEGAKVEHDSGARTHLLGSLAADRARG